MTPRRVAGESSNASRSTREQRGRRLRKATVRLKRGARKTLQKFKKLLRATARALENSKAARARALKHSPNHRARTKQLKKGNERALTTQLPERVR